LNIRQDVQDMALADGDSIAADLVPVAELVPPEKLLRQAVQPFGPGIECHHRIITVVTVFVLCKLKKDTLLVKEKNGGSFAGPMSAASSRPAPEGVPYVTDRYLGVATSCSAARINSSGGMPDTP
jgi:hypothetical protein